EADLGGNSAKATSGINACGTRVQRAAGVDDDGRYFERDTHVSAKGGQSQASGRTSRQSKNTGSPDAISQKLINRSGAIEISRREALETAAARVTPRSFGAVDSRASVEARSADVEGALKHLATSETAVLAGLDGLSPVAEAEQFMEEDLWNAQIPRYVFERPSVRILVSKFLVNRGFAAKSIEVDGALRSVKFGIDTALVAALGKAIKVLNSRRGADADGVVAEVFKHASNTFLGHLLHVHSDMTRAGPLEGSWGDTLFTLLPMTRDLSQPQNWRPMTYKAFSRMLYHWLRGALESAPGPDQAGLRSGTWKKMPSWFLKLPCAPLWCASFDLRKAFDWIECASLFRALRGQGVDADRVALLVGCVTVLSEKSAEAIHWLIDDLGVPLTALSQLGGHARKRTHRVPPREDGTPVPVGYTIMQHARAAAKGLDGIDVRTSCTVKAIVKGTREDGKEEITSVEYVDKDGAKQTLKCDAVVITTGGFGFDHADGSYMQKYRPDLVGVPTTNGSFANGDGLKLGEDLGAHMVDMDKVQLHPTAFIDPKDPGAHTKYLGPEALRGSGGILLDQKGRRFVNELDLRSVVSNKILEHCDPYKMPDGTEYRPWAWCLLNEESQEKFGKPMLSFYKDQVGLFEAVEGTKGACLCQLPSSIIGCDEQNVVETLKEYAAAADQKICSKTGKAVFPSMLCETDQSFIVARITPCIHYTIRRSKVPRLFAAGECTGGVHGGNRLGGNSLLEPECVVFGRAAGERAATIKQKAPTLLDSGQWEPLVLLEEKVEPFDSNRAWWWAWIRERPKFFKCIAKKTVERTPRDLPAPRREQSWKTRAEAEMLQGIHKADVAERAHSLRLSTAGGNRLLSLTPGPKYVEGGASRWGQSTLSENAPLPEYGNNTAVYRFQLHGSMQHTGLHVGRFIAIRGEVDGDTMTGYYSPISRPEDAGIIDILCRVDEKGGPIVKFLLSLRPGASVQMKGMGGLKLIRQPGAYQPRTYPYP
ncbi:unnamed protein product, partial [Prorocentrum cordatum]